MISSPSVAKTPVASASYDFGEMGFTFRSRDDEWLHLLEIRYRAFKALPRDGSFLVRFEPTGNPKPAGLVSPLAVHLEAVATAETKAGFRVSSETTRCDVDLLSRTAVLRGPSAMYPLDNLLRHLLPVVWSRGVLLHAGFLVRSSGAGLIAGGPSGAGKSTLARLVSPNALCDELTAVRIEERSMTLVSLPFWESRPGRAPLEALLFLTHAKPGEPEGSPARHHLEPLRPEEALKRLVSLVLWPVGVERAMAAVFDHLMSMVALRPAYELAFSPDPDVWKFIESEVPSS